MPTLPPRRNPLNAPTLSAETLASCCTVREQLDAYVDDELPAVRVVAITFHLSRCPACAKAERALRNLISAVRGSARPITAPRRLHLRVAQLLGSHDQ